MKEKSDEYYGFKIYEAFKRIRNLIRKFYPEDIIYNCINYLNLRDPNTIHIYTPWALLLIIKWTIIYGEYLSPKRKKITLGEFNKIVNLTNDLEIHIKLPSNYSEFFIILKRKAFQQFWLQENPTKAKIARQHILFSYLEKNHSFQSQFLKKTGLSINNFIELSLMLIVRFDDSNKRKEPYLRIEWFSNLFHAYAQEMCYKFLKLLSKDLDSIKRYLGELQKNRRNISYEFHEQTPLKSYPFLQYNEKYFCYSPNVLFYTLQNYLYDTLRSEEPQKFMDKFGDMFEKYIYRILDYGNLILIDEKKLREILNTKKKLVDFLVTDNDSRILIEAKGVEMDNLGRVSHIAEVIKNHTKTSVIKGITQGFETLHLLEKNKDTNKIKLNQKNNYLLIVTYKDLFLGNGLDFYENIAKEKLDELIEEYGGKISIPFNHIYFISVDDLEVFIEYLNKTGTNISKALHKIVLDDSKPVSKKLIFRQHLNNGKNEGKSSLISKFVIEEFDKLSQKISNNLEK